MYKPTSKVLRLEKIINKSVYDKTISQYNILDLKLKIIVTGLEFHINESNRTVQFIIFYIDVWPSDGLFSNKKKTIVNYDWS